MVSIEVKSPSKWLCGSPRFTNAAHVSLAAVTCSAPSVAPRKMQGMNRPEGRDRSLARILRADPRVHIRLSFP